MQDDLAHALFERRFVCPHPSSPSPATAAERELPGKSNYLIGQDESHWLRDVPTYGAVRWASVYDGVDAVFYGTQSQLEYDLVVAPGADPGQVRVRFEGQQSAEIDEAGELVLRMNSGEVRQLVPAVFEQGDAGKQRVAARCVLAGDGVVAFDVGEYDRSRPLVIDPALVYGFAIGGTVSTDGEAVAVDGPGAVYMTGNTQSTSFPTSLSAFDRSYNLDGDAFVTKLNSAGTAVLYSTYLGGSGPDDGRGIAVDAAGAAYVVGQTSSRDFPPTGLGTNDGSSVFVAKVQIAGADTAGVYIASTGAWFLKNSNAGGNADVVFSFGPTNVKPLVGDWDGI